MTRLDHNRALAQLAEEARRRRSPRSRKMTIWGNHSATQYPDIFHAEVGGKTAAEAVDDEAWLRRRRSSRPSPSAAPRSSRPAARPRPPPPPTPPSTTSTLGQRHRRRRLDLRRRSPPTAPTACPRASSPPSRSTAKDGKWEIVQGLDDQRLLPGAHRRLGRGARRGARRRARPRPDLIHSHGHDRGLSAVTPSLLPASQDASVVPVRVRRARLRFPVRRRSAIAHSPGDLIPPGV